MTAGGMPIRQWQEIAAQAAKEHNPEKLHLLIQELCRSLEERDRQLKLRSDWNGKSEGSAA